MQHPPKTIEIKKYWRGIFKGKAQRYYTILENGKLVATSSNANKVKRFIDWCKHQPEVKVVGDI